MGSYDVASVLASYDEDRPTSEPMYGTRGREEVRRNPSADQKRVRRQMSKKANEAPEAEATETDLLRKAASASTLAEQQQYMAAAERKATERITGMNADRALDLTVKESARVVPQGLHEPHTAATDWLMGEGMEVTASAQQAHDALVVEATQWWNRVPDYVKEDVEEFRIQASGLARRVASQFGEHAPAAERAFLDETERLHRQAVRTGTVTIPKTAAMIHDLENGGMVDDGGAGDRDNAGSSESSNGDNGAPHPDQTPADGHPSPNQDPEHADATGDKQRFHTDLPGADNDHTPAVDQHINNVMSGNDAAGVDGAARGYAQHVTSATLAGHRTASLTVHAAEDADLGAELMGFSRTANPALLAAGEAIAGGEGAAAAEGGGMKNMVQNLMGGGGGGADQPKGDGGAAMSDSGVGDEASDYAKQVTSASGLPQAFDGTGMHDTFPTGFPESQGTNTSSDRAPAMQELQNYQGWDGQSVVPQGDTGVDPMAPPAKDFAFDPNNPGKEFVTHAAKVASQLTKESTMQHQASCPTCSGTGHVAVRRQAASGLPQIDQIVNADESPGATPYPEQVAFGLEGWGNPGQGQQNVQNTINETEQQLNERAQKSPLLRGASRHEAVAPDNSGWLGAPSPSTPPGGKGQTYPGYSDQTGYDGSSSQGYVDPVYGQGGDNPDQPLQPYGEMEAHDDTNKPPSGWNPSGSNDAGQAYRQVAPQNGQMNTQGSLQGFHPDPRIAAQQKAILQAQANIRAITGQG